MSQMFGCSTPAGLQGPAPHCPTKVPTPLLCPPRLLLSTDQLPACLDLPNLDCLAALGASHHSPSPHPPPPLLELPPTCLILAMSPAGPLVMASHALGSLSQLAPHSL